MFTIKGLGQSMQPKKSIFLYQQLQMAVHFVSEKFHLVLTSYWWWAITYLFFLPSTTEGKTRHCLERYHFVVSTLALDLEDKFRSANQMAGISKAGGDKMAASKFVNKRTCEITYAGKSASSDCLYFCQILGNKRRQTYNESFPYLLPFLRYLHRLWIFHWLKRLTRFKN